MGGRAWTRRSVLALGVGAVGLAALPRSAGATPVTVDQLAFTVPADVIPAPADATLGRGWQWLGRSPGSAPVPSTVVLARADLPTTDAADVLGLILAGSAAGLLARLELASNRRRAMPGGGEQTRFTISYSARPDLTYHGELLIAVRDASPSALLVVLGDDRLTAGTIDTLLESARWLS